ncbi:MAG: NUDIX hydrolase [Candidatus Gottesmanbacteria bacterium GW2011_GWA1_43_11]|uniref:NUDIX hydrolase n=1 Tax=Candidatus Gottesmanbacteria bacterium GW2011_GWA1_43_11 TaxID=1618436 RepID=A0A0G1CCQ7_9BACT|nr:MAG: NUDIX hydrolase [Candidatus Gottesmanbacteria bacterium GW2011_GWA1_43_11]
MKTEYGIKFTRVSAEKLGLSGDSLDDQGSQIDRRVEQISNLTGKKIIIKKEFELIESASGDFDMQPILKALEYCKIPRNQVRYAFVKSIDRSTRGGATTYGLLKAQFAKYGVQLIDVYGVIGTQTVNTLEHLGIKYPWSEFNPTWITELLEAERGKGEVRDILTRMIGAEIRYVRMGYRVRPAPPGYQNTKVETDSGKRVILTPHPEEAPWFINMYELRIQGNLTEKEIVLKINKMGYKSRIQKLHDPSDKRKIIGNKGGKPLTVKQFQVYVQKPIYAGINTEKWTEGRPIKERFDGLVTIEMFNKANRGKVIIVRDGDLIKIYKNKPPDWQVKKDKDNPLYAYKTKVLCPKCFNQLYGSSSRGSKGTHYPAYHHAATIKGKHHYFRIPLGDFNNTIEEFIRNVKVEEKFIKKFQEVYLAEWDKREKQASDTTVLFNKRLIQIEQEIHLIKEKIKVVSSSSVIKMLEDDIEKLELERASLVIDRDKAEDEQISILTLMNYAKYFLEHLEVLLLDGANPIKDATLFELLFDELPTYNDLLFRTVRLAPLFKLNEEYKTSKSVSVSRQGFEP